MKKVQRRASRLALKQKRGEMSYEDRCRLLNWQTLEKRREFLSLIQCYKIVLGIDSLPFSDVFELTKCNRTRANHNYKLYVKIAIVNCYKFSFFVRIVNMWNNLPKDIVHAGSLTLFRNRLKIYMNIDWDDVDSFQLSVYNVFGLFIRGIFCIGLTSRISPFERYFYNFSFSFSWIKYCHCHWCTIIYIFLLNSTNVLRELILSYSTNQFKST